MECLAKIKPQGQKEKLGTLSGCSFCLSVMSARWMIKIEMGADEGERL